MNVNVRGFYDQLEQDSDGLKDVLKALLRNAQKLLEGRKLQ